LKEARQKNLSHSQPLPGWKTSSSTIAKSKVKGSAAETSEIEDEKKTNKTQQLAQSTIIDRIGPIVPAGKIDMKKIYENYHPTNYLSISTILNIAQVQFLTPDSNFFVCTSIEEEVCAEIILEKICLLIICFYAISTEHRFKEKI
jgi:hypothetical protein